jgi:hypothetical protein
MKHGLRSSLKVFLCACVLTATCALVIAQDSSAQQPAPDDTKVNERDKNKSEPTADQQKENRPDRRSHEGSVGLLCRTNPCLHTPITSRLSPKTEQ